MGIEYEINYDINDLYKLFGKKEFDEISYIEQLFSWSIEDKYGMGIYFYMSVYEFYCSLSLYFNETKGIIDLDLYEVKEIRRESDEEGEKMIIEREGDRAGVVAYFKPNFAIEINKVRTKSDAGIGQKIKYNVYELIDLFESEAYEANEEEQKYWWRKRDREGFCLTFYMSVNEGICDLCLTYENFEKPIFNIEIDGVRRLRGESERKEGELVMERLIIERSEGKSPVVVYFRPNFKIEIEDIDKL
ncbi:hypothetical protein B0S90_0616 [Caldicellulosiruptor bescii]|uniref:Uncharacterized protein n=2 Tax=Caldicellulosiruptor bescii TaxID=31899 RepID=B9MN27_CALBD|nr:hypothetical protein [Caldicellulosiruptor bescii]ACM59483.1 hypothetical protein Athe_0347 [Caldicellulosiruptor bescii DSM 6725]PBC89515.1 hypothetical protein B0S87_2619 [Caldicellulosiruptor bescii]PBC89837.1 hypothetical protein B0S89_0120 [Caldicellulosiruptor bescii]PBD04736.1 hypothetical protein B0S85_2427 [Caldicellulosiruptor bescii]PBD05633.1 hypothetical protein B0S90_0616 [Caldicellulosiruptor bescii]